MTIGIALKDWKNKRIILGADRQASMYDMKSTISDSKFVSKEVKIIDGYTNHIDTKPIHFLFAGWAFLGNYIKYKFQIPDLDENTNFIEYLYNDLVDELRKGLMDHKLLGTENDKFHSESNILIIYDGEIYELDDNFGVNPVKYYSCIGSGWRVAIGSLYTNLHFHPYLDAEEMVRQAIITCGVNTVYCDTNVDLKIIDYVG